MKLGSYIIDHRPYRTIFPIGYVDHKPFSGSVPEARLSLSVSSWVFFLQNGACFLSSFTVIARCLLLVYAGIKRVQGNP